MTDHIDVAVVGAGPYGLSVAAHLRGAGISFRHFGLPMSLWRNHMPVGMYLKSQGFASNLSDPAGSDTLRTFCRQTGRDYADYGLPVSLATFVAYADWFRSRRAPEVEEVLVGDVAPRDDRFEMTLATGERLTARRLVIATGVEHFRRLPEVLAGLPAGLVSHSSAHSDLGVFAGREVVVVGLGQSALESAALLHEAGAGVRIVGRAARVAWNGDPLEAQRSVRRRLREPEAPLGSGWSTWFYSTQPQLFRRLPAGVRYRRAISALGPAGACWLRARVEGRIPTLLGHTVASAAPIGGRVRLGLRDRHGLGAGGLDADHVIAATGYRPALDRLRFLDVALRARVRSYAGTPVVDGRFQSSVPGLHFVGPAVASTFGPVMRFVYGADFAARTLINGSARSVPAPQRVAVRP
jgi:thioredoxin reductase